MPDLLQTKPPCIARELILTVSLVLSVASAVSAAERAEQPAVQWEPQVIRLTAE